MPTTATYPTGVMRDALDATAVDSSIPADAKRRELRAIRDELTHLAGYADTLLGELDLAEQREALDAEDAELRLHEDAAIREEMLRRGLATDEQLDALGLPTAADVAERHADGTISEADSSGDWMPSLHPRGRAGEFVQTARLVEKGVFKPRERVHYPRKTGGGHETGRVVGEFGANTVQVESDAGVRELVPKRLVKHGAPPKPHATQDLGETPASMPPPRADDPLIRAGLPPLVADAVRSGEPQEVQNAPASFRKMAETDVARQVDPADWPEMADEARRRWERWRQSDSFDRSKWLPPEGVEYAPDVAAIQTPADAESYLSSRGVEAHLTPPDTPQGQNLAADADWFRQIAQAVTDAQDRYPVLRDGPHPLGRIVLWSDSSQREGADVGQASLMDDIWGATGLEISDAKVNPSLRALVVPDEGRPKPGDWKGMKTDILISDVNQDMLQTRSNAETGLGDATSTPYGRMMHELGHAVESATGDNDRDYAKSGDPFKTSSDLIGHALTPLMANFISEYAASNQAEAWAEVFATLNVPRGMDRMRLRFPEVATALDGLRDAANADGTRRL